MKQLLLSLACRGEERKTNRKRSKQITIDQIRSDQNRSVHETLVSPDSSQTLAGNISLLLLSVNISSSCNTEHIHAHLFLKTKQPQGIRVNIVCMCLCVCFCGVSVTQQERSSHLCLCSPRIPDQWSEKRQLCLALCLPQSLSQHCPTLYYYHCQPPTKNPLTPLPILSVLAQKQCETHYHHLLCQHFAFLPLSLNLK